ncbi:hypothetical protein CYMTET_40903 [Cymbomonas tetramitiformis]|uniref:Uncharacterized protein n=1 Tax=Cymbomonas tetramitiformis TaxID=36881 RepID=A0AAE0C784_9CHLO|nr:hypothetical protein CYMTET_40903 [Cymbomonas tetramitiformis]
MEPQPSELEPLSCDIEKNMLTEGEAAIPRTKGKEEQEGLREIIAALLKTELSSFKREQDDKLQASLAVLQVSLNEARDQAKFKQSFGDRKALEELVKTEVATKFHRLDGLQKREEGIMSAKDKLEVKEMILMKREIREELATLKRLRTSVTGLQERVVNLEQKQGLLKQALEVATSAMQKQVVEAVSKCQIDMQPFAAQHETDTHNLSQALSVAVASLSDEINSTKTTMNHMLKAHMPEINGKVREVEQAVKNVQQEVADDIQSIRQQVRGNLKAIGVEVKESQKHVDELGDEILDRLQDGTVSGGGADGDALLQKAKQDMDTVNRTLTLNITAVSDSVTWLHDRVAGMESKSSDSTMIVEEINAKLIDVQPKIQLLSSGMQDVRMQVESIQSRLAAVERMEKLEKLEKMEQLFSD